MRRGVQQCCTMMNRSRGETVAINLHKVPLDLRRVFKAQCAARGQYMRDRILELMQQDIEDAAQLTLASWARE